MKTTTFLGVVAIVLWSTTVAFSRSLTEALGTLTAAACIYTLAGVLACAYVWRRPHGLRNLLKLPKSYLFGCGALFVAYMVCLYLAIGLAASRPQVIVVGLINYLWPSLSLVFSIPILRHKARPHLLAGILLALAGIWLAVGAGQGLSVHDAWRAAGLLPSALALAAAVSWALYSNLSRRWAGDSGVGGVPLFLLASGVLLAILRLLVSETAVWSAQTGFVLVYMAVFPGLLAYLFWDISVRKGNFPLIASLSYLTPLLSTLVSAVVLGVLPSPSFWLGVLLVMLGAIACRLAVAEREAATTSG